MTEDEIRSEFEAQYLSIWKSPRPGLLQRNEPSGRYSDLMIEEEWTWFQHGVASRDAEVSALKAENERYRTALTTIATKVFEEGDWWAKSTAEAALASTQHEGETT